MTSRILPKSVIEELENNCDKILKDKDVKFFGVVNNLGNLVAGRFQDGIKPIGTNNTRKMMYMQLKLDLNMRKDYDDLYGPVQYVISKRRDAEKISIPIRSYMVLVITKIGFKESKINKIISVFEPILGTKTGPL